VKNEETEKLISAIKAQALALGATMVGVASVADLKKAPSYTVTPLMEPFTGVGANKERREGLEVGEVEWPEGSKAVIVVAFAHPEERPELDYWYGSIDPIGNKKLTQIVNGLVDWLTQTYNIKTFHLPYHIERGGLYLKDAAVFAGMGCIGKNNLLLTPECGSRVRLRALSIGVELPSTGVVSFDPCVGCAQPCRTSCPQNSFMEEVYSCFEFGRRELPGRDGYYDRIACNVQMKADEESATEQNIEGIGDSVRVVKYCRECEFSCPVGRE